MQERCFSGTSCYQTEGSVSEVVQYVYGNPSNSVSTRHQQGLAAADEQCVCVSVCVKGVPAALDRLRMHSARQRGGGNKL